MNFLNYDWLGFVSTSEDAAGIINDTGIFYLTISIAYFLSFLYMLWHSSSARKIKAIHCSGVLMWAFCGGCLLLQPAVLSIFINSFITFLSLLVLYHLHYTSPLTAQATIALPKTKTDDKKVMYAQVLLTKMNYSLSDVLKFTLINEQIFWLLILYRAAITLRAAFAL